MLPTAFVSNERTRMQIATPRNLIYLALVAFISFGIALDWLLWDGAPQASTFNDVTQMIGIIVLC